MKMRGFQTLRDLVLTFTEEKHRKTTTVKGGSPSSVRSDLVYTFLK